MSKNKTMSNNLDWWFKTFETFRYQFLRESWALQDEQDLREQEPIKFGPWALRQFKKLLFLPRISRNYQQFRRGQPCCIPRLLALRFGYLCQGSQLHYDTSPCPLSDSPSHFLPGKYKLFRNSRTFLTNLILCGP